jgi:hypothetical protein
VSAEQSDSSTVSRRLRQEVLLKEYEICQTEGDRADRAIWASTAVFFGISALGAGFVIERLLSDGITASTNVAEQSTSQQSLAQWSALAVAVIAIVALEMWIVLLDRAVFVRRISYYRQSEIETILGMRRSRYVSYLDDPSASHRAPDTHSI